MTNSHTGAYGRLDYRKWMPTTVTNINMCAKQGSVLHPTVCVITAWRVMMLTGIQQRHMVTVRELARLQGFPDDFYFESVSENVTTLHRQIGNAVAWPVGEALGRELVG